MKFTVKEREIFHLLNTPERVQDNLNSFFPHYGRTRLSPRQVIEIWSADCFEGALFAAAAFAHHGRPPLLLDLRAECGDKSHVVAPFYSHGRIGACSYTTHSVLRYREPVYRTVGELAMSYFHEYFMDDGTKAMRDYSRRPFNMDSLDRSRAWILGTVDYAAINRALDRAAHVTILRPGQRLRKAEQIEIDCTR